MNNLPNLSKDNFEFVQGHTRIFDKAPETKPIGFYKDAFGRFKKNKASVVAACVIIFLVLFALITPLVAPFTMSYKEEDYARMLPKNFLSSAIITPEPQKSTTIHYERALAVGVGAHHFELVGMSLSEANEFLKESGLSKAMEGEYAAVKRLISQKEIKKGTVVDIQFNFKLDTYKAVGFKYKNVSQAEYAKMKKWQEDNNLPLLFPMIDSTSFGLDGSADKESAIDANLWYKLNAGGRAAKSTSNSAKGIDEEYTHNYLMSVMTGTDPETHEPIFLPDPDRPGVIPVPEDPSTWWTKILDYSPQGKTGYQVRVLSENYFLYKYGKLPSFFLGTNNWGQDIIIRLAKGMQTSLILSVSVVVACFIIGSMLGATQGYYGGWFDLISERILEILANIPFYAILVLVKFHWINNPDVNISPVMGVFIAFVMLGWIGDAGAMRSQFYRFKHHEYALAARTLGASDARVMFKHILPNSLGTIITGLALAIPSMIFAETSLSYLGLIDFEGPTTTSVGTMLSDGQLYLSTHPHIILWPAFAISLLMISFNLFGNGLRDAFNPQLRGVE